MADIGRHVTKLYLSNDPSDGPHLVYANIEPFGKVLIQDFDDISWADQDGASRWHRDGYNYDRLRAYVSDLGDQSIAVIFGGTFKLYKCWVLSEIRMINFSKEAVTA